MPNYAGHLLFSNSRSVGKHIFSVELEPENLGFFFNSRQKYREIPIRTKKVKVEVKLVDAMSWFSDHTAVAEHVLICMYMYVNHMYVRISLR